MKINHEETKDTKEVEDRGSKIEDRGESIFDPRSPILDRLHGWSPTGVEIRRRSQVVRRRSAKPLYAGSIPAAASKITRGNRFVTQGFTLWFTGLSGAGKTTLTNALVPQLRARGVKIEVLDGDEVRTNLSKGLGFSKEDRDTNIRRIGYVAQLLTRNGAVAITAAISPYRAIRDEIRGRIGDFVEVYAKCPLDALIARDVKGLYKKALAGEIKEFTGVSDPYEAPLSPEVVVETDRETVEESVNKILTRLQELGFLSSDGAGTIAPHGGRLVNRLVTGDQRMALLERARALPKVQLDERAQSDVEMI